jgi:hypothetical protein
MHAENPAPFYISGVGECGHRWGDYRVREPQVGFKHQRNAPQNLRTKKKSGMIRLHAVSQLIQTNKFSCAQNHDFNKKFLFPFPADRGK